ncbi:C-type lectin domain family 4 member A-like isoform X1 [Lepus europaeus]|uniref:C-type lectin domain family 4 member A-like isoform X1 n=1 Tax=Lepus europaeus TaxID=9983 RepID=UPI002B4653D8|nr:C-type lectin domain family 4 member A-like isoform X1 [Lepus europaeus]
MTSEITYAEVRFNKGPTASGIHPGSLAAPKQRTTPHKSKLDFPKLLLISLLILFLLLAITFFTTFIIFFQKYSQLLEEKKSLKELNHTALECMKNNFKEKVWSCCPKNWKPFSSNCYLISTESKSWHESKHHCSAMEAHLLVINSKDEQDFIIQNLKNNFAYYVGLSDPEGQRHWQWVDETPYNANVTFWHAGEPSDRDERCVILNYRPQTPAAWGWNDIKCFQNQMSVCEMMKIYL